MQKLNQLLLHPSRQVGADLIAWLGAGGGEGLLAAMENPQNIVPSLQEARLASMVGARREWINRILSEWRRRGLLEFENGVITILDLPRVVAERDSRLEANQGGDW